MLPKLKYDAKCLEVFPVYTSFLNDSMLEDHVWQQEYDGRDDDGLVFAMEDVYDSITYYEPQEIDHSSASSLCSSISSKSDVCVPSSLAPSTFFNSPSSFTFWEYEQPAYVPLKAPKSVTKKLPATFSDDDNGYYSSDYHSLW